MASVIYFIINRVNIFVFLHNFIVFLLNDPNNLLVKSEKINGIGEEISTHITPELTIGAPVYVDDILGIGDCKTVEKCDKEQQKIRGG